MCERRHQADAHQRWKTDLSINMLHTRWRRHQVGEHAAAAFKSPPTFRLQNSSFLLLASLANTVDSALSHRTSSLSASKSELLVIYSTSQLIV